MYTGPASTDSGVSALRDGSPAAENAAAAGTCPAPQKIERSSSIASPDSGQLSDHQRAMENCSPQHCSTVLPIIAQVIVGASAKILTILA
jgi:hypothetical protein